MRAPYRCARSTLLVVPLAVVAAMLWLCGPAMAADTVTTFDIESGTLSISAPASVYLGHVPAATASISGTMGNIEVADNRDITVATWIATVTTTTFSNGTTTIPTTDVSYSSPAGTVTGPGSGTATGVVNGPIGAGKTAQTFTAGTGVTTTTWDPTVTITLTGATAGHYTGTITHSVS
jgi:hypothetical protein